jgi:hypothetical protein
MELFRLKLILFVLIISFTIQSCAGIRNLVSPNAKPTTQAARQSPTEAANLAQKNIEASNYQKAIDIYISAHRKQPRDLQLMKMYVKSLDDIKLTADNAFGKKDFANAGRIYYVLQKNYAKYSQVVHMLSFDNAYLNTNLNARSLFPYMDFKNTGKVALVVHLLYGRAFSTLILIIKTFKTP